MSLEYKRYAGKGAVCNRLTTCPLCPHEFGAFENRWKHFLDEHDPEDAGLTPLGERNPDADGPLFPEPEVEPEGTA